MLLCGSTAAVYSVMVRASNSVSNASATMEFVAEKPVTGLSINASTEYVQLGNDVLFQAYISSGTDVHFDWSFGDLESATDTGTGTACYFSIFLLPFSYHFPIYTYVTFAFNYIYLLNINLLLSADLTLSCYLFLQYIWTVVLVHCILCIIYSCTGMLYLGTGIRD